MTRIPRLLPVLTVLSILLLGAVVSLAIVLVHQSHVSDRRRIMAVRALTLEELTANYVLCRSSGRTKHQCRLIERGTIVPSSDLQFSVASLDAEVAKIGEAQVKKLFIGRKKAGVTGKAGPAGALGPAGPRGLIGLPGQRGVAGMNGGQGSTGPRGLRGVPGLTGPPGPTGPPGTRGPAGATGQSGPAGMTCPNGYIAQQITVRLDPQGAVMLWACVLTR